jgi:hypothetical protein
MNIISIETSVDQIEITSLPHNVTNPKWTVRDAKGHLHGYIDGELPTLKAKHKKHYTDDGDGYIDEWTETWYVCRRCNERIEPGTVTVDHGRQFIPGLQHVTAEVTLNDDETPLNPGEGCLLMIENHVVSTHVQHIRTENGQRIYTLVN